MSERIIKLLGSEVTVTANSATTLNGAQLVRVLPRSNIFITIKDGATTTGTCSIDANQVTYIRKKSTETIQSSADGTLLVSVAFGD